MNIAWLPIRELYYRRENGTGRPYILSLRGIDNYVFVHKNNSVIGLIRNGQHKHDIHCRFRLDNTYFQIKRHVVHYYCCVMLQRWFRKAILPKRNQRRLAAAMALHPRLGSDSALAVLTADVMSKVVGSML